MPPHANGRVQYLYLKPARGQPPVALAAGAAACCEAGLGIHSDVHAHRLSPRQILITEAGELAALGIPPGAMGENMVIACDRPELLRPGSALLSASGVHIRLTMFCEACARIAHVEPDLGRLWRRRGVLGVFVSGGELRAGDALRLVGDSHPALPDAPYQRFLDLLPAIPRGRVLRYADVALAIGVADSFVRALPGYIRRGAGGTLPLHRIVNARGQLPGLIADQAGKLAAEGVSVRDNAVDLARYLWQG